MKKRTVGLIVAFVIGQAVQLVFQGMVISLSMWDNRRIPFCLAAGFVILFAILGGVYIARMQDEKLEGEFKKEEEYLEYAKIPESKEAVIDPFKIVEEVKRGREAR